MDRVSQEFVNKLTNEALKPAEPITIPKIEINTLSPLYREDAPYVPLHQKKAPGFFENAWEQFKEHQEILALSSSAGNILFGNGEPDFTKEIIPEGWNPYQIENIQDLNDKYWEFVLSSESPAQLEYRRTKSKEQEEHEERLAQGGIGSTLVGAGFSLATSPSTYFLPLGAATKYAGFGIDLAKASLKAAPTFLGQGLLHEGIIESSKTVSNYEDAALNGVRDAAFGIAFYGAARGINFGANAANVWKSRAIVNVSNNNILTKVKVGPKGEYKGLVAEAAPGVEVPEAELLAAQVFLDNGAVLSGLSSLIGPLGRMPVFGTPLIKGLTSPWGTVRQFYNRMGNQSVVTGAIEAGQARQITAEEILREISNHGRQTAYALHDLYVQSLGLNPGMVGSAKAVIKGFKDGISSTRSAFNTEVMRTAYTGTPSAVKEVNAAAKLMREGMDPLWKRYLEVNGYSGDIKIPVTAQNYLMRNYDLKEMVRDPQKWVDTVTNALRIQDESILAHMQPINTLQASVDRLRADLKLLTKEQAKPYIKELNRNIRQLKKAKESLRAQMQDGKIDLALLEERPWLNESQLKELKKLNQPIYKLNKQINQMKRNIPKLGGRPKGTTAAMRFEEIKKARAEIKVLREQREAIRQQLIEQAKAGNVNAALFFTGEKGIQFRSATPKMAFRKVYATEAERINAANAYREAILNITPEQMAQSMLSRLTGGAVASPTQARSLLIPDIDLLNAGFLSTDLSEMIQLYSRTLGKRVALKEVFADMNWNEGALDMAKSLKLEFDIKKNALEKQPRTKARDKVMDRLNHEREQGQEAIKDAYDFFMGNQVSNSKSYRVSKAIRNWTATTMLRNVPLLQIGELGGMVFKQRLWPMVSGGILPLVRRINSKAANEDYKLNASHALVGVEMELQRFSNTLYDGGTFQAMPGIVGGIETFLQKSNSLSQSIFLTNQVTNSLQRFSANVTQSRVMGDMFKMVQGKLSQADQKRLLMNGINPKDAQLFVNAYNKSGGFKMHGGYVSKWYEWEDAVVRDQMGRAIRNDVTGSILEAGLLDKPFWSHDPILGLPVQFAGYIYAAFNKFTVPLLQNPDASKVIGFTMMLGYGAMTEPLRKWQKGEPFELSSEKEWDQWFYDGLSESGVLGYPVEIVNTMDGLLEPAFLDRYKQEKFRRRSFVGLLGGPMGSLGQNVFDTGKMFMDGKINQTGLIKAKNTIPVAINTGLDALLNRAIRSTDLPETRKDADYYSYIDRD